MYSKRYCLLFELGIWSGLIQQMVYFHFFWSYGFSGMAQVSYFMFYPIQLRSPLWFVFLFPSIMPMPMGRAYHFAWCFFFYQPLRWFKFTLWICPRYAIYNFMILSGLLFILAIIQVRCTICSSLLVSFYLSIILYFIVLPWNSLRLCSTTQFVNQLQ